MATSSSFSPAASDTEFETSVWCVNGQALNRVITRTNGVAGAIVWTDAAGAVVTPTAPQIAAATPGSCAAAAPTTANNTIVRTEETTAGTTTAGLHSVTATNVGVAVGQFQGADILPGESVSVSGYYDEFAKVFVRLPALSFDGTGTTLHIVTQA